MVVAGIDFQTEKEVEDFKKKAKDLSKRSRRARSNLKRLFFL
jgi:hypothetical protein|tara:strand:- start:313 stop:438 length:126 start_codon:yes stop_codon:yes gene_type:complete